MKLCVVVPSYNEGPHLTKTLLRIKAASRAENHVVVVDDGSTDDTFDALSALSHEPWLSVVRHHSNRGKGAALRSGFEFALARRYEAVLVQDADLEYAAEDHDPMVRPLLAGLADVVIGSRFTDGRSQAASFAHYAANRALTRLSNALTRLSLTDMECGLKAFTRPVLEAMRLEEDRFGVEPEIVAKAARLMLTDANGGVRHARVVEVPVRYSPRSVAEGKKLRWRDGAAALLAIARHNLLAEHARRTAGQPTDRNDHSPV